MSVRPGEGMLGAQAARRREARRSRFLEQRGLRVIRFESDYISGGGLTFVLQTIAEACEATTYD